MNKTDAEAIKSIIKMIEYCKGIPEEKEKWVNHLLSFLDGYVRGVLSKSNENETSSI